MPDYGPLVDALRRKERAMERAIQPPEEGTKRLRGGRGRGGRGGGSEARALKLGRRGTPEERAEALARGEVGVPPGPEAPPMASAPVAAKPRGIRIERGMVIALSLERHCGEDVLVGRVEWTNEQGLTLTTVREDYPYLDTPTPNLFDGLDADGNALPQAAFEPGMRSYCCFVPWSRLAHARLGVPDQDFDADDVWDVESTSPDLDAWLQEVARPFARRVERERDALAGDRR